ncbi:hypothetical protein CVT24_012200 [Panaeolus cyanescens]|uniref:Uncharacterized protein n=1 Tax=Panaeolus cyanescens TaxID=181874 RepID=A0A409YIR7_9AGAR|nr:hypothetical protein CVT24_012200 [Panaeolus cyanescens]
MGTGYIQFQNNCFLTSLGLGGSSVSVGSLMLSMIMSPDDLRAKILEECTIYSCPMGNLNSGNKTGVLEDKAEANTREDMPNKLFKSICSNQLSFWNVGLFFVYCEAGSKVNEADVNEWYDETYIPKLFTLPEFLNAQRYTATDSRTPHFLSTFTVTNNPTTIFNGRPFQTQVKNVTTPVEEHMLVSLQTINRRDMELVFEYPPPSTPSVHPAQYLLLETLDFLDDDSTFQSNVHQWYNNTHITGISKIEGWTRSRRFKLNESAELNPVTDSTVHLNPPKYYALHEFTNDRYKDDLATLAPIRDEKGEELFPNAHFDMRHFALYRAW